MRELELAADALDRSGYDASSKRARNEAYAARAVLARWGRPTTPPAPEPGEVGELVAMLRDPERAEYLDVWFHRAADLLQQQAAPAPVVVPVAVSERLPGEGDCDASWQCWWFTPDEEKWIFWPVKWAGPECSHWLPAHALPLPQAGEVSNV